MRTVQFITIKKYSTANQEINQNKKKSPHSLPQHVVWQQYFNLFTIQAQTITMHAQMIIADLIQQLLHHELIQFLQLAIPNFITQIIYLIIILFSPPKYAHLQPQAPHQKFLKIKQNMLKKIIIIQEIQILNVQIGMINRLINTSSQIKKGKLQYQKFQKNALNDLFHLNFFSIIQWFKTGYIQIGQRPVIKQEQQQKPNLRKFCI
eukprot:TRINITY_DN4802_c2_g1_i2.p2 TRINITY_DN4802_c2_g1~~TRINITY_DN4802_c2_g1_i2.p2  ORF type:complete len:206 (+),score=-9.79 TRINITY_DN4802_c2_g1_i2:832-1449(+)